ncbi:xaa-Pro aminopeptidase 3 isoform X1 [Bubalus kerabau]|uniref:xaa-Pro aminopeptidase 3 isoform X1 n=1 Tax=Bubalus carabanensis TaxID=3119969 RepID=UPI00244E94CC|nr:xaa-Pro aminopeptidase 3 isoform X1 [Bubalus carabanensis]
MTPPRWPSGRSVPHRSGRDVNILRRCGRKARRAAPAGRGGAPGQVSWRRSPAGDRFSGRFPRFPPGVAVMRWLFSATRLVPAVASARNLSGCLSCSRRRYSLQPIPERRIPNRYLGQPSPFTHPHLLRPGEVTPGLSQVEYALRRHKLMSLIHKEAQEQSGTDHTVVLLSSPTYYMSNDIPYTFHQDNNFLYLCGFQEPDSILVLQSLPGKQLPAHKAMLFVPRRDPSRELWDGPRSGTDGAIALTGVDEAYTLEEFQHLVPKLKAETHTLWYDWMRPAHKQLHCDYMQQLAEVKARSKNKVRAVQQLVQRLRLIKSPAEIERMQVAGKLTSQAFIETMFASKAPVEEGFLYAKFEFECRARGADILAYPPVVAGGNRSNTLHYVKNNQLIKDGEMVLLDGGCESSCYVSDITRTWPVNGRFTAPQAELYEAVLEVQRDCLTLCCPGTSLENIYSMMLTLISQKLKELGITKNIKEKNPFKAARKYCPHHVGHYLGMDVHDTPDMPRSLPLQPGMVITVEPGIYIPEDDQDAPERFRGLGVRIEDDVVVTEASPLVLSADCPKEMKDIEQICSRAS